MIDVPTAGHAAHDLFPEAPLPTPALAAAHRAARLNVPLTHALKVPALRLALVNLAIARHRRRAAAGEGA